MPVEVKTEPDPDFPNKIAYRIDCPKCGKFFLFATANAARNAYSNHRQTHNGESEA